MGVGVLSSFVSSTYADVSPHTQQAYHSMVTATAVCVELSEMPSPISVLVVQKPKARQTPMPWNCLERCTELIQIFQGFAVQSTPCRYSVWHDGSTDSYSGIHKKLRKM